MFNSLFWKNKKVFLTGNTGFKGSWLTIWLEMLGAEVTGYALPAPTEPSLFFQAELDKTMKWISGDVRDLGKITHSIIEARPDVVIHMAAQPIVRESYVDPVGTYATNVMGTVNLLEGVRSCDSVRSVVVVTTDKCYENQEWAWGYRENEPMGGYDPYSNSKGCAELVTSAYRRSFFNEAEFGKKHRVALASARAGNVIGGGDYAKDRLIPDIVRALMRHEQVVIRSPHSIRPWQHVLEPLAGYLSLAEHLWEKGPEYAEAWNFGPNDADARPVQWIVDSLCKQWPGALGWRLDSTVQPHEATYLKLDISKATSRLGWRPVWNLETALQNIVSWNVDTNISALERSQRQIMAYQEAINEKR